MGKNKNQNTNRVNKGETVLPLDNSKTLWKASLKFFLFSGIIFSAIYFSDYKGYFNSLERLDHISKRWNAFYEFTEQNEVDILLIGNSHMFHNVNPKNLSTRLGANAIIVGGPGASAHDIYFSLKEALTRCSPSLVVFETFGIDNSETHKTEAHLLTHQLNSFTGRKNTAIKLESTPILFSPDQYGYAWSKTIRNHNYIFKNTKQLSENYKQSKKNNRVKPPRPLHLGQLTYYTQGLVDSTLQKFETIDAPVDGNQYDYSSVSKKYVGKIVELCQANNIKLMFFTTPMYRKNIKDYDVWKTKLNELLSQYPNKWLDLQDNYSDKDFPPICFQNAYDSPNQHLTNIGALVATYKLADFIENELNLPLTNRSKNNDWHRIFYGQEGYFENHSVAPNDKRNQIVCKEKTIQNATIKEVCLIDNGPNRSKTLMVKVDQNVSTKGNLNSTQLILNVKYKQNETVGKSQISIPYDRFHTPKNTFLFTQGIRPDLTILEVIDGAMVYK